MVLPSPQHMGSAQKRHLAYFVPSIFSKKSQMTDLFTMLIVEIQFSDCERVYIVEAKKIMTSDPGSVRLSQ